MFWDGFHCREYGEHEFTSPMECSISIYAVCYRNINVYDEQVNSCRLCWRDLFWQNWNVD